MSVVTRAFDGHIVGPSVMWTAGRHASDCCADQSDVIIHAKKRGSAVAEGPRDSSLHGIFFAPYRPRLPLENITVHGRPHIGAKGAS